MKTSEIIAERIKEREGSFFANENIADHIEPGELVAIESEVRDAALALLRALVIDVEHDHNTLETADRLAKMYVREVFAGRYAQPPRSTTFPNVNETNSILVTGPITVRSACSHHMVPIIGQAWVAAIPGDDLIGLSKFNRLIEWVMARPQIQEEAAEQCADVLEGAMEPEGLAVVIRAQHLCCQWRGVKDRSEMTSSVMRGIFREDATARAEVMNLLRGHGC